MWPGRYIVLLQKKKKYNIIKRLCWLTLKSLSRLVFHLWGSLSIFCLCVRSCLESVSLCWETSFPNCKVFNRNTLAGLINKLRHHSLLFLTTRSQHSNTYYIYRWFNRISSPVKSPSWKYLFSTWCARYIVFFLL